jgi:hypothetical protein
VYVLNFYDLYVYFFDNKIYINDLIKVRTILGMINTVINVERKTIKNTYERTVKLQNQKQLKLW